MYYDGGMFLRTPSGTQNDEKFDTLSKYQLLKDNVSRGWLISPLNHLTNHEEQTRNWNRIATLA